MSFTFFLILFLLSSSIVSIGKNKAGPNSPSRPFHRSEKIEVRESQTAGVFLAGSNIRIPVTSAKEAFQLINKGNKYRAVGTTQCNGLSLFLLFPLYFTSFFHTFMNNLINKYIYMPEASSRSHAILTLHVESRVSSTNSSLTAYGQGSNLSSPELRLGKMHLVDLAGSERITMSGAEGDTLIETQSINLSLTALGDVLSALSKNANILAQQQLKANGSAASGPVVPSLDIYIYFSLPLPNSHVLFYTFCLLPPFLLAVVHTFKFL